jgi:hypothetical protein
MLRYLLDTNIVIYVLKRRPVEVLSTFNANASAWQFPPLPSPNSCTVRRKAAA